MLSLTYIAACVLAAYAGIRFVVWAIKRSLPVPLGAFMWIRFFFWWTLSVLASVAVYACAILVLVSAIPGLKELGDRLDSAVLMLGAVILSAPYWVGVVKGIDLQTSRRWSS
ncbi:hypothetical protein FGK63_13460 [Ruegeria sediminis]|uniref:Uncharacterized protein n=1 Tax=Ruegeria sediminis TaxID=2583820 RepID=A0ABY2WX84_9RHOB|nr:hypothetical protein [Ruegeria sediminis]TMV07115.1 hypothetical protein FGK63_13460 [Ruegeria sediminis]